MTAPNRLFEEMGQVPKATLEEDPSDECSTAQTPFLLTWAQSMQVLRDELSTRATAVGRTHIKAYLRNFHDILHLQSTCGNRQAE